MENETWNDLSSLAASDLALSIYDGWAIPFDRGVNEKLISGILPDLIRELPVLTFEDENGTPVLGEWADWNPEDFGLHTPFVATPIRRIPWDKKARFYFVGTCSRRKQIPNKVNFVRISANCLVKIRAEEILIEIRFTTSVLKERFFTPTEDVGSYKYILHSIFPLKNEHGLRIRREIPAKLLTKHQNKVALYTQSLPKNHELFQEGLSRIGLDWLFPYEEGTAKLGQQFVKNILDGKPGDWLCITEDPYGSGTRYYVGIYKPDENGGLMEVRITQLDFHVHLGALDYGFTATPCKQAIFNHEH